VSHFIKITATSIIVEGAFRSSWNTNGRQV